MNFNQLTDKEKIAFIEIAKQNMQLESVAIEKDVWVTAVLRALFALPYANQISFKGGTSLSK